MAQLSLQLVTPSRTVISETVDSLSCPTTEGEITILPGHIPLVTTLKVGELTARSNNQQHFIHVSGGFVEVKPNNEVIILADEAEHFYEIDQQRAEEAKQRAEQVLEHSHLSGEEYAHAAAELERSLSRLRIARKHAHRKLPITSEGVLKE